MQTGNLDFELAGMEPAEISVRPSKWVLSRHFPSQNLTSTSTASRGVVPKSMGFIAQEVEQYFPEAVSEKEGIIQNTSLRTLILQTGQTVRSILVKGH